MDKKCSNCENFIQDNDFPNLGTCICPVPFWAKYETDKNGCRMIRKGDCLDSFFCHCFAEKKTNSNTFVTRNAIKRTVTHSNAE